MLTGSHVKTDLQGESGRSGAPGMLRVAQKRTHCLATRDTTLKVYSLNESARTGQGPDLKETPSLLRSFSFDANLSSACWEPSDDRPVIAAGFTTGTVEVINPWQATSEARQDGQQAWRASLRQQRNCTDVRINRIGQLAVGLDKVRHDASLLVYDLATQQIISQFANSEGVSSCVWFPDAPHLLLAGVNYRWLRLFDTRADPRDGTAVSIPTKLVGTLAVDVCDPTYFASSFGDQVCLWDRRSSTNTADLTLTSSKRVKELAFSPNQRLHLAALTDNGLDLWHLGETPSGSSQNATTTSTAAGSTTTASSSAVKTLRGARVDMSLAVQKLDRVEAKVISFDFGGASAWDLQTLSSTHDFQRRIVRTVPPTVLLGGRGDVFALHQGEAFCQMSSLREVDDHLSSGVRGVGQTDMDLDVAPDESVSSLATDSDSFRLGHPYLRSEYSDTANDGGLQGDRSSVHTVHETGMRSLRGAISNDIATTMYKRARLAYGMDAQRNSELVVDRGLQTMWKWIAHSSTYRDKLHSGDYIFAFEGALNILQGIEDSSAKNAKSNASADKLKQAIRNVADNFGTNTKDNSDSAYRRKLALTVIGWSTDIKPYVAMGKLDKAAFYTLVGYGDVQGAVNVLAQGPSTYRIMAAALAGYLGAESDAQLGLWKEQTKRLAIELDSPYIRALFAFVSNGDWRDVLDEQGLSLKERLATAISYLRDDDLAAVLRDMSKVEHAEGNLEGLLLTGISRSTELLQRYLDRTADVQTVALVASFSNFSGVFDRGLGHDGRQGDGAGRRPSVGSSHEIRCVEQWISEYRLLLNRWGMFHARCRFDQDRRKIRSIAVAGKYGNSNTSASRLDRQVFVRCTHCGASVVHRPASSHEEQQLQQQHHHASNRTGSAQSLPPKATACPSCRRALPRCALCLLPLGGPSDYAAANRASATSLATTKATSSQPGGIGLATNSGRSPLASDSGWFNFCLSCRHGLHTHHADQWFAAHDVCPVSDCDCRCLAKDMLIR